MRWIQTTSFVSTVPPNPAPGSCVLLSSGYGTCVSRLYSPATSVCSLHEHQPSYVTPHRTFSRASDFHSFIEWRPQSSEGTCLKCHAWWLTCTYLIWSICWYILKPWWAKLQTGTSDSKSIIAMVWVLVSGWIRRTKFEPFKSSWTKLFSLTASIVAYE